MRKFKSFFLTFNVCLIIIICIAISLDLTGVVRLPEKLSLKKYLSKSIGILGSGEEVYYPNYEATGINAENNKEQDDSNRDELNTTDTKVEAVKNIEIDKDAINELLNSDNTSVENTSVQGNQNNQKVSEYNVTDNSYFYMQLDTYGKIFYSRLYDKLNELKSGTYTVEFGTTFNDLLQNENGEELLTNAFQLSINALLLDHPEIFYLDVTKMYMFTESTTNFAGTTYKISIGPDGNNSYLLDGFRNSNDVRVAEDHIKTQLYIITSTLNGSTYDKAVQVHNYLIDSIEYDSSGADSDISHTLYGALVNKYAVCDGYAKAFKFILDNIGISCVEICGTAQNSSGATESHAWNDVLIDGKWYAIDVTWDDPIIIGGNGRLTDDLRYSYFLKGSDTFYNSHQEDGFIVSNGEFKYPIISTTAY